MYQVAKSIEYLKTVDHNNPMIDFPNPRLTTAEGLVAVGGNLKVETLVAAYSKGIFPWPQEGYPMLWFCPDPRGVLDFHDFHVPTSLKKFEKKHPNWKVTTNQAFPEVIRQCRLQKRPGQSGTWISKEIQAAYIKFFEAGFVLSLEVWDGDELIGGIYGVLLKGLFSGESMFYKRDNASKIAFWKIVEHLKSLGHQWMDIQMVTSVTKAFGGKYIPREEFLRRLGI
ncbi:MAG: leucyl/phenylalanyl-tRNA--protein transferase [Oligoflexia bacterium]|nr:MAG: leucyl/phenylalanyl-tRNA--protein transferase [Oligoflexia bacterium]